MIKNEFLKRIISSLVLLPIICYIIINGSILFNILIVVSFFISIYEWSRISINTINRLIGYIFLFLSFNSIYFLRTNSLEDYAFFLIIFTTCIATDIGGYVVGKLLKGPKLLKISPNKTISGMVGGFFFSIISIFVLIKNNFFIEFVFASSFNTIILVIFISGISQIGDISISYFKRLSNVKDTGYIIPGHGGLLDRIDGMIFAFPISFLILKIT